MRFSRCILCAALALFAGGASAKHIYQYTDAKGIVHFTDVKPGGDVAQVKSTLVRAEGQPLIRVREDGSDLDRILTFINSAGGPVSVAMEFEENRNVRSEPPLPARFALAPLRETQALHILPADPAAGYAYRFRYRYMPGDFRAQPDPDARYQLPFPTQRQFRISQAFNGQFSHNEAQNRYAVDIVMPEGTPVLAAREGVVMTVDSDFYGAGLDMAKYGDRANNIRIVHSDGTMAVYAHLQLESTRVQVGEHVNAGQQIALSGDTGFTSGPHLHFCVQRNADMELVAVPFQFSGPNGTFTPVAGMDVGGY